MKCLSQNITHFKESIFATMSKMAHEHGAINLSQGFPDFDGPKWIKEFACETIKRSEVFINQYAPSPGINPLRETLSLQYKKYYDLSYDPQADITITNGATEAIFITCLALLNPGDEVIIFEPFYDSYLASIQLSGAKPVAITLKSPEFCFNLNELEKAINKKTKMIIVNNPHNPSGRVFSKEELQNIADLAIKHDLYVMSDEVYEFLTFDQHQHMPMATFPKMHERTITISSAGKTFGFTGWKIGWALSSSKITHALRMVHQFNTFSVNHPFQYVVTEALKNIDDYIPKFKSLYQEKRDYFIKGLKSAGFNPIMPQGTYFIMCPINDLTSKSDIDYCKELIREKKVAAIPPSSFYMNSNEGKEHIRFCFAKETTTLEAAIKNLKN